MKKRILITGGAGFIGTNTAAHYAARGDRVTILDNFSRFGSRWNADFLAVKYPTVKIMEGDVRDEGFLKKVVEGKDIIFHFAGQVAVTTSLVHPREDFDINARGTLNLLEAVRLSGENPLIIDSSTNKVYGDLTKVPVRETPTRYEFAAGRVGISEAQPLDFYSPYGCSKGTADSYMLDYHRIYGLSTIVFRQSCIYGPRQCGVEDQGWVAWLMIAALLGKPITIYGNGKQVRDLLYIDDLLRAFDLSVYHRKKTVGQAYNIGGGINNALSIWKEFGPLVEELVGRDIRVRYAAARPGDQNIFIADTARAKQDFSWEPAVGYRDGLNRLFHWIKTHEQEIQRLFDAFGKSALSRGRRR